MNSNLIFINRLFYISILVYTSYLYSLRCDFFYWGNSKHDGLYLLAIYILIVPMLLISSTINHFIEKVEPNYELYIYIPVVILPALISLKAQSSLFVGTVLPILISIIILFRYFRR